MNRALLEWLETIRQQPVRYAIGLISGTSMDGIDGALVAIEGEGAERTVRTIDTFYSPYTKQEVDALHRLIGRGDLEPLVALDAYLGERFAEVALTLIQRNPTVQVDFIGSHGQTVWHAPHLTFLGKPLRNTLQIGQPEVLYARTGVPVVADFRTRDMAFGGQGAPLVPFVDWLLLRDAYEHRATLNIGGIANLTILPANSPPEQILAFDTGPGNALINCAVYHYTNGRECYDKDGHFARRGQVMQEMLHYFLMEHEYFKKPPPKSTGREEFGAEFWYQLLNIFGNRSLKDWCATLVEFTALTIADALQRWVLPQVPVQRVIASGGGVHHPVLMERLRAHLAPIVLSTSDEFGIDPDYKEAIAFAVLADCYLRGEPASYPSTTGVDRPTLLGRICFG